jgi:hypothetical protein
MMAPNLEKIYLRIRPNKFYYLKFILEAYDGLGIVSSTGIRKDIIVIRYPDELRRTLFELLGSIAVILNPYRSSSPG